MNVNYHIWTKRDDVKKLGLLWVLLLLSCSYVFGQQLPQFAQYYNHPVLFNPAYSGSVNKLEVKGLHRSQWVGFENAPVTQIISSNASLMDGKLGAGGYVFNDQFGPLRNTGIHVGGSSHLDVGESLKASLGLSTSLFQANVNGGDMELNNPNDNLLTSAMGSKSSSMIADASFGLMLYNDFFYVGFSGLNLIGTQNKVFKGSLENAVMPMARHFYFLGALDYEAGSDMYIKPAILINYTENAPIMVDLHFKINYQRIFEAGVSYRVKDAVSIVLGGYFMENFGAHYSYDVLQSGLSNYSSGSHELSVAYILPKDKGFGLNSPRLR